MPFGGDVPILNRYVCRDPKPNLRDARSAGSAQLPTTAPALGSRWTWPFLLLESDTGCSPTSTTLSSAPGGATLRGLRQRTPRGLASVWAHPKGDTMGARWGGGAETGRVVSFPSRSVPSQGHQLGECVHSLSKATDATVLGGSRDPSFCFPGPGVGRGVGGPRLLLGAHRCAPLASLSLHL